MTPTPDGGPALVVKDRMLGVVLGLLLGIVLCLWTQSCMLGEIRDDVKSLLLARSAEGGGG